MKPPNPFVMWEERPKNVYGRREELAAFISFMSAISAKQSSVMIITGSPGMGKTLLLRHFRAEADKSGLLATYIKVEKGETLEAAIQKIYQELTFPDQEEIETQKTLGKCISLLERKSRKKYFGSIVFIDDIDRMKRSDDAISEINNAVGGKEAKLGFILSSTKPFRNSIALRPFDEHEAKELIDKTLKATQIKMGEEGLHTILMDTQGNPRLLKSTCWYLYEMLKENEKIISRGHYLAHLPSIMSMLSRELFGSMYQETPEAERQILLTLAKDAGGAYVSEIAKQLKKPLGPITTLTGRLLERGQIVKIERGKYRIFSILYARYVIQRAR